MTEIDFDAIADQRYYGSVTGGFEDLESDISDFENLDRASIAMGVCAIGDDWLPITRNELVLELARLIGYDSAYGTRVVSDEQSREFAELFANAFGEDGRFYRSFQNDYDPEGRFVRGYSTPLTDATFSYGLAGLDSRRIGIIVVCDED